jgi:hypothetical protein
MTPLFDVNIHVFGTDQGTGYYTVTIFDRYHPGENLIGGKTGMTNLDEAIEFAKGAVTAFMEGTSA